MAALEQQLFASGLPVEALMEKAALAVARAILSDWDERLQQDGALVLVGPGHNGGDGLVIARELHLAGIAVAIWSPFERHKPLTSAHLQHALWLGIPRLTTSPDPAGPALWIDAVFGIGQTRPAEASLQELLAARQRQRPAALVAVDVPTGIDDSSGIRLGRASAVAAITYSIGLLKCGLVQDQALGAVGHLRRIDLGLPQPLLELLDPGTTLGLSAGDAAAGAAGPWPRLDPAAGKYGRGRLLVIAGSEAYRGAGLLALMGASASGLGSLRAAVAAPLAENLWQRLPHVVVQRQLACSSGGSLRLGGLQPNDLDRLDAVLLGPGIGNASDIELGPSDAEHQAWALLQAFSGLLVLDADGLNRCSVRWLQGRAGPTWITPHNGEFARLWPLLEERPAPEAAAAAAADCGAVVLLKGARSVIATPCGTRWQLLTASAAAARAGLGDVLAGYASGSGAMALASGLPCDGAWLAAAALDHALAGHCDQGQESIGDTDPMAVATRLCQQSLIRRTEEKQQIKT
jgi:NAD(P)H-hydrate epimerase